MLTVIALLLALIVLPSPWNWIVVIVGAVLDLLETGGFLWWSRRRRRLSPPAVGVEDLVGRSGVAATALVPEGQVRVNGEIWSARSSAHAERGSRIVVRSVDGLVLGVEPEPGMGHD